MLAPVRDLARTVDTMLATGDVSALTGLADAVNAAGELLATRITGGYEVDEFGFDEHFHTHVWLPLWRPLFEHWFRVEVIGAENIPAEGAGLIVSNHAGVLPIDGMMTTVAVHDHACWPVAAIAVTWPVAAGGAFHPGPGGSADAGGPAAASRPGPGGSDGPSAAPPASVVAQVTAAAAELQQRLYGSGSSLRTRAAPATGAAGPAPA